MSTTAQAFDRDEAISFISDVYKDINGFRPRFYDYDRMTNAQLDAECRSLSEAANAAFDAAELERKVTLQEWKERVVTNASQFNVSVAKYVEWEMDALMSPGDFSEYAWSEGLLDHRFQNEMRDFIAA